MVLLVAGDGGLERGILLSVGGPARSEDFPFIYTEGIRSDPFLSKHSVLNVSLS